ncbi:MAG: YSC84-related protein [Pseudomonadota bacterium]|nr:YSC84-related protein [Pseudomonadota bacterium]
MPGFRTLLLVLSVVIVSFAAAPRAQASAASINADVTDTLNRFFRDVRGGRDLANKAAAVLIFPSIVKAGFGIGGEYGEGALHVGGRPVGYYNIIAASVGFQLGIQTRSVIIMFMTQSALDGFRNRAGFEIGVDGSVTLLTIGAGGQVTTDNIVDPIVGFVFNSKGLMYNLTLEGSKISRINP